MSFQVKEFASIAASIINHARAVQSKTTDFTPGSVARTLLESPAVEIEQVYIQFFQGLIEAIPTAVYSAFGFDRQPAKNASGPIGLTITSQATATVVPAGTTWQVRGASGQYTNPADVTIPAGNTAATVRVVSTQTGASWNVPGGTVFDMIPPVNGFVSAVASADFGGGADAETDDQRKQRFITYIAALPHGTLAALDYILQTVQLVDANGLVTERVASNYIDEPWERDHAQPRALVQVYIFNGVTGASPTLVQAALNALTGYANGDGTKVPGYKAAGVHVDVFAATIYNMPVTGSLVVLPGYTYAAVAAAVQVAITTYLLSLPIGRTAFPGAIVKAAEAVAGVASFTCTAPAAPYTPALGVKVLAGTFTITQDTTAYAF